MNKVYTILIFCVLFSSGCRRGNTIKLDGVPIIKLDIDKIDKFHIDSIANNVRWVPLETRKECLIEKYDDVRIIGDMIFVLSNSGIQQTLYVFDLNGRYLFKIDAQGNGPGEYMAISSYYVNTEKEQIDIFDQRKVSVYNFNGQFVERYAFNAIYPGGSSIWFRGNNYSYALEHDDAVRSGSNPKREFNTIAIFDSDWNLLSHTFPRRKQLVYNTFSGGNKNLFSLYGDTLFVRNPDSYIIYQAENLSFIPRYILDYGTHGISEKELAKLLSAQSDDDHYFNYYVDNKLCFPRETRFYFSNNYWLIRSLIGRSLDLFIYDPYNGKSGLVDMYGAVSGKVLLSDIYSYENLFYSVVDASRIITVKNYVSSGTYKKDLLFSGPFSPSGFSKFNDISDNDNAIIVFFDFRSDILK